jgi:hypothetical protein
MSDRAAIQTRIASKPHIAPAASGMLQRACACGRHTPAGGECEECQERRAGVLQRAAIDTAPARAAPPIVHEALRSPGQPLDASTRAYMEPCFGRDFSGVRVHTDARAAESARAVDALAYTVGRDVVFGAGQYAPGSSAGRRLMAHELAHVVQQKTLGTYYLLRQTRGQVARDVYLRSLAERPLFALEDWQKLPQGERTIVVTYMTMLYSAEFAHHFLETTRRKPRPETLIEVTNLSSVTPATLTKRGFQLGGRPGNVNLQIWVHPSGREVWLLSSKGRSTQPATASAQPKNEPGTQASQTESPGGSEGRTPLGAEQVPTWGDPEDHFGKQIASQAPVNIGGLQGFADYYEDGTIELYKEDGSLRIFRPYPGGAPHEYELYDEEGKRVHQIYNIDPNGLFFLP